MAEMAMNGESPEVLFWVGCSGSFDQRAQKITRAFAGILDKVGGPLVIEVNASPGLEGIEGATGVDVAGAIVRHIETHVVTPEAEAKRRRDD